jgi:hypothetical protein
MTQQFIRVFQELNIDDIRKHLLIHGDLSSSCSQCSAIDLKLDMTQCPECKTEFKYIAFRNIKDHLPKIKKLKTDRPNIILVDFEDFKRLSGALKAKEFLK